MRALSDSLPVRRYLERQAERALPLAPRDQRWHQVLVIPAYRETVDTIHRLMRLPQTPGRTLVILVLNRPDTDADPSANDALRGAVLDLPSAARDPNGEQLFALGHNAELLLLDLENSIGATPAALGVGLARKCGCDLALQWAVAGAISSQWICCTDADATLPADYFSRLESVNAPAAVFPFTHIEGADARCFEATLLYEHRLRWYVDGLEYAGSPYAFHTVGSCIAVQAEAYAQVRGFPQRAGGEDFYLLNKLTKLAPVARLEGDPILLTARASNRVPFGTGPAVQAIMDNGALAQQALFYAPAVFAALKQVIASITHWAETPPDGPLALVTGHDLPDELHRAALDVLATMKVGNALAHCHRQSRDIAQFTRQFHQWFDGFRTLKFIHALSAGVAPRVSITELQAAGISEYWKSKPSDTV